MLAPITPPPMITTSAESIRKMGEGDGDDRGTTKSSAREGRWPRTARLADRVAASATDPSAAAGGLRGCCSCAAAALRMTFFWSSDQPRRCAHGAAVNHLMVHAGDRLPTLRQRAVIVPAYCTCPSKTM